MNIRALIILVQMMICVGMKAQSSADPEKLLGEYLRVQQQRIGFNGVVLVTRNDQLLYREAIGKASMELDVPMSHQTSFRIASITKSFTAQMIVLAAEEGRLRLSDSLAAFFPELKDSLWRAITIDQLLSHRSGIPHNEGIPQYWAFKSLLSLTRQQALAEIFGMKLLFDPGTDVHYSSPGYFLLAAILENIYGQQYAAILKEKICAPLGMRETGIYSTQAIISRLASSYHLQGDSLLAAPYRDFSLMKGSGDMYASADDLARWMHSFFGNYWSEKNRSLIFSDHTHKGLHGKSDHYGYGWFIREATQESSAAYYVGGGTFGCSAITAWYPNDRITITILSNVSVLPVNELWGDIEKIVFRKSFVMPQIQKYFAIDPGALLKFQGSYVSDTNNMGLLVNVDKDRLFAKLGNNPAFEIFPESPFRFSGKKVTIAITFLLNDEGMVKGLEADGRGQRLIFRKVK